MIMSSLLFMFAWLLAGLVVWFAFVGLGFRFVPTESEPEGSAPGKVFGQSATTGLQAPEVDAAA